MIQGAVVRKFLILSFLFLALGPPLIATIFIFFGPWESGEKLAILAFVIGFVSNSLMVIWGCGAVLTNHTNSPGIKVLWSIGILSLGAVLSAVYLLRRKPPSVPDKGDSVVLGPGRGPGR